jgi:2-keto-4-pentenoate hydratase/2-oxohepta-3-ene-1,7-dioic acid hydratase in catechol pathway
VTYRAADGRDRAGLVEDGTILALPDGRSVRDLLGDDGETLAAAAELARRSPAEEIPLAGAALRPPVSPGQIRDCAGFLQHLRNGLGGAPLPEQAEQFPAFYFSNTASLLGPNDDVAVFAGSRRFDFELEVAAVIGRPAANVAPEAAARHIAGLVIFCDWSARDVQAHEMKAMLGPAKGKDGASTLGPLLVTADELAPFASDGGYHLEMEGWVNEEQIAQGWLDTMDWSFAEMIAYTSRGTTLLPGDLIGSGTVPSGCLLERYVADGDTFRGWLQPGDRVRLRVQELGETDQRIVAGPLVHRLRTGF